MSSLCLALALLAASPEAVDASPADTARTDSAVVESPRTGRPLQDAVREALRRWARPEAEQTGTAAREFLGLFAELQSDEELTHSQRQALITKVRGRLAALTVEIRKQAAIQRRKAEAQQPKSIDAPDNQDDVLAQWGGMMGGPMMGGGMMGRGMPGMMGGGMMGRNQGPPDNGEELADLIQTTIAPASWERNGGLGSIYYWKTSRAMVVRQTGEVHNQMRDLLQQLQRANR